MRLSLRRIIFLVFLLLSLSISILLLQSSTKLKQRWDLIWDTETFDRDSFKAHNLQTRKDFHYTNYLYSGYDNFTQHYANDLDRIQKAPLNDKCNVYFNQFLRDNPDWKLTTYNSAVDRFDKSSDRKEFFFKESLKKLEDQFNKAHKNTEEKFVPTREDNKTISTNFNSKVARSKAIMHEMADVTTSLRVYGKCFIGQQLDESQKKTFNDLSSRFFPFLTQKLPQFKIPNEDASTGWPISKEDGTIEYKTDLDGDNYVDFVYKHSKGKGIVISTATRHAKDIMKLIQVLRAMNNELPIQIMHKGDLTKRSLAWIETAATVDVNELLDPSGDTNSQSYMPDLKLLESYKEFGSHFPKQNLQFVNIAPCIPKQYKFHFPGYTNKILAVFFSSFDDVLLLDADTVPLVPPKEFFESEEYKKSGTYYFQDRSLRDTNDFIETNFFASLSPTNEKSIDTLFDIPRITEKTFNNKYMTGWRHYQEAGVVAFNKRQHYLGLLMMLPLSMWTEPIQSSIWGDKELYWLALSIAGDENYEFNPVAAASIGEKTSRQDRKYYPNSPSNEVCSTHPGHVNKDGKLLWINSGFGYCKKNGYFRDRVKFPFSTFEKDELSLLYHSPLQIRAAMVPPNLPRYREPGNPIDGEPEEKFKKSWKFRNKDIDEINENLPPGAQRSEFITEWGPQKGWVKNSICFGYYYCAYDKVQSYSSDKEFDEGTLYEFDEESVKRYNYLSKVWNAAGVKKPVISKPK
ncbi:hypothetical protein CANMA_005010 [Candida margitis]|uniref:uncharacterized protein n=1 Tax=Candida margitis TaxID=1775924 RepID=UPI0022266B58|nr:uncharacterized protein CANMA_005010 [Candida margitis]KAI5953095.1 hypothetical protein CANMA_005010 [Candida margitis]